MESSPTEDMVAQLHNVRNLKDVTPWNPITGLLYKTQPPTADASADTPGPPPTALIPTGAYVKIVSILDKYKYVQGYFEDKPERVAAWRADPYNPAFVDAFVMSLASALDLWGFPTCYATFQGVLPTFAFDITDEFYEQMIDCPEFIAQVEKGALTLLPDTSSILGDDDDGESEASEASGEDTDDSSLEDMPLQYALAKEIPVQVIVMEALECTLQEYVEQHEVTPEQVMSWAYQVHEIITGAQRRIGLFHNDLHVNNVMVKRVPPGEKTPRGVPMYGTRLYVIDFGRSIVAVAHAKFAAPKIIMSRHLHADEEAGGQVNWGPLRDASTPEVAPNPAADFVYFISGLRDLCPRTPPFFAVHAELQRLCGNFDLEDRGDGKLVTKYDGFDKCHACTRVAQAVPLRELSHWLNK